MNMFTRQPYSKCPSPGRPFRLSRGGGVVWVNRRLTFRHFGPAAPPNCGGSGPLPAGCRFISGTRLGLGLVHRKLARFGGQVRPEERSLSGKIFESPVCPKKKNARIRPEFHPNSSRMWPNFSLTFEKREPEAGRNPSPIPIRNPDFFRKVGHRSPHATPRPPGCYKCPPPRAV